MMLILLSLRNPARLSVLFAILFLLLSAGTSHSDNQPDPNAKSVQPKTGIVTGKFVGNGKESMAGGQVIFYKAGVEPPPNITRYIRVPLPRLTSKIQPDGSFRAELPGGKYFFGAIKRNSGKQFGMPSKGDYYYRYYKPNSRELQEFSVNEGDYIDFGTLEARPFRGRVKALSAQTAIKGRLSDMDGKPVENCLVFAFPTPQMLRQLPLFVSSKSGKNGEYILNVAGDSTYYLLARDVMGGGQVKEGGLIGFYGEQKPVGVTIQSGAIVKNIDIKVKRMGHRGPELQPGEDQKIDPRNKGIRKPSGLPANGERIIQENKADLESGQN